MVVHGVEAELGIVHLRHKPAQRQAILAAVTGILGLGAGDVGIIIDPRDAGVAGGAWWQVEAGQHGTVGTAFRGDIVAEEGAAVIDDRAFPLDLVEHLGGQAIAQALGQVEHVDRNQAFLDLGTGATQGRNVNRVDRVDRVADEGALPPADDLFADPNVARQGAEVVVVVHEAVEEHCSGRFGGAVTATVVDVVEQTTFILELKVIPILTTDKYAGLTILELQIVHALEDLRERLPLLEIQPVVVVGTRRRVAPDTL
ncbi:hypothetical protein D3C72_1157890 [compost metagenome]